jgi:hypothetical protein
MHLQAAFLFAEKIKKKFFAFTALKTKNLLSQWRHNIQILKP